MKSSDITIDIVFDNISCTTESCYKSLWGFSAIIHTPEHIILFDTGSNGRVLLQNLKQKNFKITDIDSLFISHGHWDHIGGLDSVVELNENLNIYVTKHLSKNFIRDYSKQSKSVTIIDNKITKIGTDIYSSGAISETLEQSIIIDTKDGLIIIFGCAHNGVGDVTKMARDYFNKDILLVMGGFHLANKTKKDILQLIEIFKNTNTKYICPSHCTGEMAKELFSQYLNDMYIEGEVGQSIKFDENSILRVLI